MAEKKKEKFNMHDFAVHDCTKEQNGSPYSGFELGFDHWGTICPLG